MLMKGGGGSDVLNSGEQTHSGFTCFLRMTECVLKYEASLTYRDTDA
jgi:hypothetical protein